MDLILEAYASSSDEDEVPGQQPRESTSADLPPPGVQGMFADSEYDLGVERRRAEERAGPKRWIRSFPHERGNWPTHVYIPVPNSPAFVKMAEASVADFRRRLEKAWMESKGTFPLSRGRKRKKPGQAGGAGETSGQAKEIDAGGSPPEVVVNDMSPSGEQHLSLSRTVVLRAHQIEPFSKALQEAVRNYRRFTVSIVSGYDVLVNEQKTRSFLCLRVRGGRHVVQQLIVGKVDPVMRRFKQPLYYQDPVVHVSIASVQGDVTHLIGHPFRDPRSKIDAGSPEPVQTEEHGIEVRSEPNSEQEEEEGEEGEDVPSEVSVGVELVACKAGTTVYCASLCGPRY